MSDTIAQTVLPADETFVTIDEARSAIMQLADEVAPTGGTRFGITRTFYNITMLAMPNRGGTGWRIAVAIEVPLFATMSCAWLAGLNFPGARRRIEFVLKADADAYTVEQADGVKRKAHRYTFLNGSYQFSTEMKEARKFRDLNLRMFYETTYETDEFKRALSVLRSELTGEAAFPRPWTARRQRSSVLDWRKGR